MCSIIQYLPFKVNLEKFLCCSIYTTRQKSGCERLDLNQRPLGYEPNELPNCSTPRHCYLVLTAYSGKFPGCAAGAGVLFLYVCIVASFALVVNHLQQIHAQNTINRFSLSCYHYTTVTTNSLLGFEPSPSFFQKEILIAEKNLKVKNNRMRYLGPGVLPLHYKSGIEPEPPG
jgi:hypothetical protein